MNEPLAKMSQIVISICCVHPCSPRNRHVAGQMREGGLGTLLFDLLTPREEQIDDITAELRFNIPFLANR